MSRREADGLKTITNLFQIVSYPSAGNVGNQKINSLKSDCSSRKAAIIIMIIEPSFSFAIFPLDQCFNLFSRNILAFYHSGIFVLFVFSGEKRIS